jgi:hypothetical protein
MLGGLNDHTTSHGVLPISCKPHPYPPSLNVKTKSDNVTPHREGECPGLGPIYIEAKA